jgi:hypothetical protein
MPNPRRLFRFPATIAMLTAAVAVILAAMIWNIDLIEVPFGLLNRIEKNEFDEILVSIVLVIVAFVVDQIVISRRAEHESGLDKERLRVVQVTMRTVQDVVNNCLNQMQLLRMDAEDLVSPKSLTIFDSAIQETSVKLRALGDLKAYAEKHLEIGIGLDDGEAAPN